MSDGTTGSASAAANEAPPMVFAFGAGRSDGDPARADLLGGKGASLAAMSRAGFPVPPGFTISAECCAYAEAHGGEWPPGLERAVRSAMTDLERATGRSYGCGPNPLLVAVRSGAGVSMPGMMDTILNCGLNPSLREAMPEGAFERAYAEHVRMFAASVAGVKVAGTRDLPSASSDSQSPRSEGEGGSSSAAFIAEYEARAGRPFPTDARDALVQCINAVFASWNSERARAYRQHHDIRGVSGTAVNVQEMFPSQRSGVLFTTNPQNPDAGEMILEASWGLGEAVVSGAVTPDVYVVDRDSLALRSAIPGDRPAGEPALDPDEIRALSELGRRVEQHFGGPSDIEWGIADGRIALLQSRPIRGLDVLRAAEALRQTEIVRLRQLAGDRHAVWVVHNLGETLPNPTPLTWDVVRWFMSGDGGFGRMYRRLGFSPSPEVRKRGFLELVAGRIYVDPVRAAGLFWGTLPFEYDAREILEDRATLDRPPARLNVERADPFLFLRLPGLVWQMWRSSRTMRSLRARKMGEGRFGRRPTTDVATGEATALSGVRAPAKPGLAHPTAIPAQRRFDREALPALERFLESSRSVALSSLSTVGLLAEVDRRIEFVLGDFAAESLLPGFFGGIAHQELERWLVQIFGPERGVELTDRLIAGLDGDVTIEQNMRLYETARGERSMDDFLREFGHRAAQEMELSQPRWREDHAFLDRMLGSFRAPSAISPSERHAVQAALRLETEADLPRLLEEYGGSSLEDRIATLILEAQTLLPYREIGKYHLMRGYETIRSSLIELAARFDFGRDLFFLRRSELPRLEASATELRDIAVARRREWQAAQKLALPDVIDSRRLDDFGRPPRNVASPADGRWDARPIAPGVARGPARIVRTPEDAGDLGTGYVLVCPTTDPGWTPLFLNCKGLVVERGGVLSHGAIVARDFGIPAAVLENATRLIPDGATVEVDAHHGGVTIVA